MSGFDREQLEALRRQVEDDYRLDIAAIERLQRRFFDASSGLPASNASSHGNGSNIDSRPTMMPPQSAPAEPQSDELVGSLRSMFNVSRK